MQLAPDDEGFIAKHTGDVKGTSRGPLSPDDEAFIQRAVKSLGSGEVPVSSRGTPLPDWNFERQALDALTNGQLTRDVPKSARAKAEWERANPTKALMASTVPPALLLALVSTAAGKSVLAASEVMGVGELGEALTGLAGRGAPGLGGAALRAGSQAVSGGWQGALASSVYPSENEDASTNVLTGLGLGAGTSMLARIPGAALRSNISPRTAELARRYQNEGVPLRTAQVPGASWAAKAVSSLLHLGHGDSEALTRRAIASMGHDASILDKATVDAAQSNISAQFKNISSRVPQGIDDAKLRQDISGIATAAHNGLQGDKENYAKMKGSAQQIYNAIVNGKLNGETYFNLTQKGSALSNLQASGRPLSQYANAMRDALDDALERAAPNEAPQIRLARNQWRNSVILDNLKDKATDVEGHIDPKKLSNAVISNYGGYGEASQGAALAGNPVDIGTLAEGGKRFPTQPGAGGLTYGTLGAAGLGLGLLGEHFGPELGALAGEHPVAAGALGALGAAYGLGGVAQNTQPYLNMLLRSAQRGPQFTGSLAVPLVNQLYKGSDKYDPVIQNATDTFGGSPALLRRQIAQESGFQDLTSDKGAQGVAQFMPGTAKKYGVDVHDSTSSILGAAHYMRDLRDMFGGNDGLALAGYNWGEGNVNKWLAAGGDTTKVPKETRDYVRSISGKSLDDWLVPQVTVNPRPGYYDSTNSIPTSGNLLTGGQ